VSFLCFLCHNKIPGAARHVTTEHGVVLCDRCADDGHARMYPLCDTAPHGIHDDNCVVGTRLGAHRAPLRIWRAQELTG
jgi:hypothetical protein